MKRLSKFKLIMFLLSISLAASAQDVMLTGVVTDVNNEPLIGVNVVQKGTTKGTITDIDGRYSFEATPNSTIVFTYIGFAKKEVVWDGRSRLNVTLSEDAELLDEVVVVGYGTQRKVNLTGAVSQVDNRVLENRPAPNLTRLLQGTLPNLNIKMADGSPTRTAEYNIRGITSIGAGGSALVLIDGVEGDPNLLNPNDVETVSILKDASSAAIYGSRAAFGVVLITTKSAKAGKPRIDLNISQSFNKRTVEPDLVSNGYEWAKNFDDAFYAWYDYITHPISVNSIFPFSLEYLDRLKKHNEDPSLPEVVFNEQLNRYEYFGNTDWFDVLYKDVMPATDVALSVSGGNENANFYLSGRYYYQSGIFNYSPDEYDRFNIRAKGEVKASEWLRFEDNFDISTYNYDYPLLPNGDAGIWRYLDVQGFPMAVITNPDGTYTHNAAYTMASFVEGNSKSEQTNFYVRNTAAVIAEPIKDMITLKADFTFSKQWDKDKRWNNYINYSNAPGHLSHYGNSRLRQYNDETTYWVSNITADIKKNFNDVHAVNALVGLNVEKNLLERLNTDRDVMLVESKPDYNLMDGLNYRITGGGSDWAYVGLFYRLNYNYQNKYMVEFNGRNDGSSKFPTTQQWGFFPSISAGWTLTEEPFIKDAIDWLYHLKLRASYGTLGNGNVAPYRFLETMSVSKTGVILSGVQPGYTSMPSVVPDGLTWEKATTFDVGTDITLFNNKLSISYDWYNRETTDMFTAGPPLPNVFGATVPFGNYADLSTKGWEISLSWRDEFTLAGSPFRYSFNGSLWDSKSFITKFNNPTKIITSHYVGKEMGEIWGFETLGLFTSEEDVTNHADQSYLRNSNSNKWLPGDLKFADLNNDGEIDQGSDTLEDPGDRKIIGNNSPRYQFGFTLGANWNGFGLSAFFQGIGKRDWYFAPEADLFYGPYNRPYGFQPVKLYEDMWSEENPDGYFPRYRGYTALGTNRSLGAPQTRYLQDASYIRLKNLSIDYTVPIKIAERMNLTNAQIFISGQNIFTASGIFKHTDSFDPEVIENPIGDMTNSHGQGDAYPMLKTWTVGLNLTF
jgi:TonB-linked SusC/RagA family outer membrane protein